MVLMVMMAMVNGMILDKQTEIRKGQKMPKKMMTYLVHHNSLGTFSPAKLVEEEISYDSASQLLQEAGVCYDGGTGWKSTL